MGGILWRKNDFECPVEFNTQSGSRSNKWFTNYLAITTYQKKTNYLAITVGSDSVTAFSLKVTIKNFMYCFLEITFVVAKSL
jgi:hypothetical protein